jgi:ADP-ribose pyrophosphatase
MTETPQESQILSQETLYRGFLRIERFHLRHTLFAGGWSKPFSRELLMRGPAAAVLLYDPDRDVLVLVEQFRMGPMAAGQPAWMIEIAAGIVEHGLSPEETARREAMEEAGCEAQDLFHVLDYFPSPGGSDESVGLFCARVDSGPVGGIHGLAEENEDIRVMAVPAATALEWVDLGHINNAITLVALLWFARHRETLRRRWQGSGAGA